MDYQLPKKWYWQDENNNISGNRPTAGPRFDYELPRGDKPFQVYSLGTPNGQKVTIMLEELRSQGISGLDYDLFKIDIGQGDQFGSGFVEINPNSKIPALVDYSSGQALRIFESGSIILYLADKFKALIPEDLAGRTECLNWVFWQMGGAPFVGGGFGHFFTYAPEKIEYPINRYTMETKRLLDVLDQHLEDKQYLCGDDYTIADIMNWPWFGRLALDDLYSGSYEFLDMEAYPHVIAWAKRIAERPAVKKGLAVDYQLLNEEALNEKDS